MGHVVMVGVMSMTPVHIDMGPAHGDVLRIVGLVLSAHILGMYALSPVAGWMTDRFGRRPVVLVGAGLLMVSCAVAGTAGHDTVRLTDRSVPAGDGLVVHDGGRLDAAVRVGAGGGAAGGAGPVRSGAWGSAGRRRAR